MRHTRAVCVGLKFLLVGKAMQRKLRVGGLGLLLALSVCTCALGASVTTNIAFPSPGSPNNVQYLDLYRPSDGPFDRCTIVLVHGGAYSFGDKSELGALCSYLADMGYAVVCPNYVLLTSTVSGFGPGTFPQPSREMVNVVHWVRSEGQAFGLSQRVIMSGGSAGATIAVHAAMVAGNPTFTSLPPAGPRGYVIDGVVGFFGRYDLAWNAQTWGLPGYVMAYVGLGSANLSPADSSIQVFITSSTFANASAATFVNACSPPSVLIHGDADPLVPVGNTYRLQQAMTQAGAPVRTLIVPGGTHSMMVLGPTEFAQAQTIDNSVQWILQHQQADCGRTAPPQPPPEGRCCAPDTGVCTRAIHDLCPGDWSEQGVCSPNPCPAPMNLTGACCMGATCSVMFPYECNAPGMSFIGANAACNAPTSASVPCCRGDFNHDGQMSVQDVFGFLNAWFAGDPRCVADDMGARPTVTHIFLFLNAWFGGC